MVCATYEGAANWMVDAEKVGLAVLSRCHDIASSSLLVHHRFGIHRKSALVAFVHDNKIGLPGGAAASTV